MPKQYLNIKESYQKSHPKATEKEVKSEAAKRYIGGGKSKAERSERARALQHKKYK